MTTELGVGAWCRGAGVVTYLTVCFGGVHLELLKVQGLPLLHVIVDVKGVILGVSSGSLGFGGFASGFRSR